MRAEKADDVRSLIATAKQRRAEREKYKLISNLLDGKTINVTGNPQLFEALNREKMDFEELMRLHPDQVNNALELVKYDREFMNNGGRWWNASSKAKWGTKGHIPMCCYYARPVSYWRDKKLAANFFNTFTKFRISESRV